MNHFASLQGARVLVTGASGFIGKKLCTRLIEGGADVTALAKDGEVEGIEPSRWCRADVTDYPSVLSCLELHQPEVVFHAAALVSGSRTLDIIDEMTAVNLIGSINIMRAAVETTRPKVIMCGSMEEAPEGHHRESPNSPYAASKHAARIYGKMFHVQFNLDVTMTRIFMVYGPGQQDTRRLIPYVITSMLQRENPQLGSGSRLVDWVYIDDVVSALGALASSEGTGGKTFDIGTGKLTSIREVVEKIGQAVDPTVKPGFGELPDRGSETEYRAEFEKLASATDWRPQMALTEGLQRTIEWFRTTNNR